MKTLEERFKEAESLYDDDQFDKAFPLLKALADEGYVDALNKLGSCYYNGYGVPQDKDKANELWGKAGEREKIENKDVKYSDQMW